MNNLLYSHLYLHLKNMFTLKPPPPPPFPTHRHTHIFANLLNVRKTSEEEKKSYNQGLHLSLKFQSDTVFSFYSCKSANWFLHKWNIESE